jgi:hypothetical protein
MSTRTTRPESIDDLRIGMRTPEDDTLDLIKSLREGKQQYSEPRQVGNTDDLVRMPSCQLPDVVERVLNSQDRAELIEVARMLDRDALQERFIIFYTPVGDIRCRITWLSCTLESLRNSDSIFFVKMRSSDVAFTPKSGARFEVGFSGYNHKFDVVCLAPPQSLYPGVDLMCFLPHNTPMEKNGKLKEGAPSVVSGEPSDTVNHGEPVVEGEKSAKFADFDILRKEA